MSKEIMELVLYRINRSNETLDVARELFNMGRYRDANNRSYYAAYYAMKAVYSLQGQDFSKHKTLIASFNKEFVASEIFPRSMGKKISTLALIREQSDYNDFYVASKQESMQQIEIAEELIGLVNAYLNERGFG